MPDVVVIFCDGSVRREESGFCNIDQSSAAPVLLVSSIISYCLLFTDYIGVEIRKSLEPVFADQLILETFQVFFITEGKHFLTCKEVDRTVKIRVCLIPVSRAVVACCIAVDDLFAALSKDINVVISNCFGDFYILHRP